MSHPLESAMNKGSLVLIALIIVVFVFGAYRVNQQAIKINEIVRSLSPLVFSFQQASNAGGQSVTFLVTCDKTGDHYVCRTDQLAR